jgi:DNA-binding NarL/FixJ family response regulator
MQRSELPNHFDASEAHRRQVEFIEQVRAFRRSVAEFQRVAAARHAAPRAARASPPNPPTLSPEATDAVIEVLTPRQREIAALIALGYTNQRIADTLVLTPGTVANHIQHILERLDLRSRTQVAVWYADHGVIRGRRAAP